MIKIELLDDATINKIAAGEVVERPLSVVKELVENSIDAGATAITVEIKGGGTDLIRVTDNGSGIPSDQVRNAFLPHATSKIKTADDLMDVRSLGFRGEALSTVAAVAQTEMVTKPSGELTGVLYKIDGGKEVSFEEVGCADGTTIIARNLFLHVPARRKFLKSAMTEASYVTEFMERIAISRSDIAFRYIVNNDLKLVTSGNGSVKDNIYRVFGKDIMEAVLPVNSSGNAMSVSGYVAKPLVARNNRSMEIFFVNGHAVKDKILEKAVETAYKPFLMQHKFPFVILFLNLDPGMVDVNIHPRKTEVRFSLGNAVYDFVEQTVEETLRRVELINRVELFKDEEDKDEPIPVPENEEVLTGEASRVIDHMKEQGSVSGRSNTGFFVEVGETADQEGSDQEILYKKEDIEPGGFVMEDSTVLYEASKEPENKDQAEDSFQGEKIKQPDDAFLTKDTVQMDLFEDKIIEPSKKPDFEIIGCVFDTYWIIEYKDRMIMIDQHAAHEKVMYESFMKQYRDRQVVSQYVDPPVIITASGRQGEVIERFMEAFNSLGFEIERFQGNDYALRAVPSGFMKLEEKEIFESLLDELSENVKDTAEVSLIHDRLAQMSCKAAVKGGNRLSLMEADKLLSDLLSLDNPYNCPHGRPTMVEFTERDLEKFFKRIV
ncbi:MAG: DNA mismatch repair endonuclease MutL [Lachnospiraceae bacterium]|nr:DNA mismatch repair endonuclease MutL [Lachnospiraceae bacterium]